MADAVLTSLCGICHICPPKYKCPRCNIATCSLKCITTHKAWSQCSGERDQTAYVAKSKLATAAGIDHDYNFLHSIEMASERAERVLVEDKGIIQKDELRPLTVEEVRWKVGRDGRKRKVLITRVLKQSKERLADKLLASKLKKLNTVVVSAPQGMTRQKENNTTISRKSGRINWQVEWFTFEKDLNDTNKTNKSRVLSKLSDDVPLYVGYNSLLESQAKTEGKVQKRSYRGVAQNPSTAHWQLANDSIQDPQTGSWISIRTASIDAWPREHDELQRRQFQFFLESAQKRSNQLVTLTPIPSEECLRDVLSNTKVFEFPAIYVLREGEALPTGFVLGPKDTVPGHEEHQRNSKRKGGPQQGRDRNRPAKRRRPGDREDVEEGELGGPDEEAQDGMEAGDVIAEQSLSEGDDDTSDDDTSSSGSDSD
ncbi:HIT zinc finger domain-containing protein [Trichoderma breve]|uniref:HIT zinc finger domain-containing protein n=1 Tax=Trichoderma breve TaxID=2034170 RepID=A0A9W9BFA0_9HYPO|nr:HIT zinc finger domain-containing protein [Trichoderma breve]KAJ4858838.1 HIT zinc finger domain-containing protein [Trichoderma breve]